MIIPLALLLVALGAGITLILLWQYLGFCLASPKRVEVFIGILSNRKRFLESQLDGDEPNDEVADIIADSVENWEPCAVCETRGYIKK